MEIVKVLGIIFLWKKSPTGLLSFVKNTTCFEIFILSIIILNIILMLFLWNLVRFCYFVVIESKIGDLLERSGRAE